jgi:hypothetical protein
MTKKAIARGKWKWKDVGGMSGEELMLEQAEASHTTLLCE